MVVRSAWLLGVMCLLGVSGGCSGKTAGGLDADLVDTWVFTDGLEPVRGGALEFQASGDFVFTPPAWAGKKEPVRGKVRLLGERKIELPGLPFLTGPKQQAQIHWEGAGRNHFQLKTDLNPGLGFTAVRKQILLDKGLMPKGPG